MDLVEGGKLATDAIKFFVLDEADRLLDTGNLDTILKLFARFPKGVGASRLQVCRRFCSLDVTVSDHSAHQLCSVDISGLSASSPSPEASILSDSLSRVHKLLLELTTLSVLSVRCLNLQNVTCSP